jgi:molecular chaperone HscB
VDVANPLMLKCWNCQKLHQKNSKFTCNQCNKALNLTDLNYYEVFGLKAAFDINDETLNTKYLELQQELHPDKFIGKDNIEISVAMQNTMYINQAYQTLKNDESRISYLIEKCLAIKIDDHDISRDQELLIQELERRESLEFAHSIEELNKLFNDALNEKKEIIEIMTSFFTKQEDSYLTQYLIKFKYLNKFINEVKAKKAKFI